MTDLPRLDEIIDRLHVVALPLRVQFRGIKVREAALIEGPCGWGEFAPFAEYQPPETSAWLASALESAFCELPAPQRQWVEVNATIPAVAPELVPDLVARYPGCRTFKVKVAEHGQTLADDCARVAEVRREVPGAIIRVDANRGWSVAEAVAAAENLGELDYLEQPCYSVSELVQLREELRSRGISTRVAADESIRRSDDPYGIAQSKAADVAVLKVPPLGGVRRMLHIAQHLHAHQMHVTVASALDTGVGLYPGLLAAANQPVLQEGRYPAAGLATQELFLEDIVPPLELSDGYVPVIRQTPEPERLAEFRGTPTQREHWIQRISAAYARLNEMSSIPRDL
ncbi:o-succinylbenzoate synthase [Corynebacterium poyangense]|uniref:O-succinylbenzoate synthase n=1 Tax=Corynebacterium poyangense TaxID=2684405 RepID=A0A7H0SLX3_9CORY|nr:o-succinylbenzoate synthase [Corynebacterium poyangense]MBZ8177655.1 o-succinylbenzoate synthase [Corynebacterium poyangense]QNQ89548.1 o-succinylbenzoate synthase [Corynebacterium poyangense]